MRSGRLTVLLCLLATGLFSSLFGAITIEEIYHKDYDVITRLVIACSGKPDYSIERQEKQITITINRSKRSRTVPPSKVYDSPVVSSVHVNETETEQVMVVINTVGDYHLESFYLSVSRDRIVLDIFNTRSPQTPQDKIAFIDFYTSVGYHDKATPLINEIERIMPDYTGIHFYRGRIQLRNNRRDQAIASFRKVKYDRDEYLPSLIQLMRLGEFDFHYDGEVERTFLSYRDYFLRANNINRQRLMTSIVAGLFGDDQEALRLMRAIDSSDDIPQMLRNLNNTIESLGTNPELIRQFPQLSGLLQPSVQKEVGPVLPIFLLIIIVLLITIYIVSMMSMKKKYRALESVCDVCNDQIDSADGFHKQKEEVSDTSYPQKEDQKVDRQVPVHQSAEPLKTAENDSGSIKRLEPESKQEAGESVTKEPDSDLPKIRNEELVKKMANELFDKGWDVKSIAEELQTTDYEIDKYISGVE